MKKAKTIIKRWSITLNALCSQLRHPELDSGSINVDLKSINRLRIKSAMTRISFTLAEVFSPHSTCQRKFAFTLAEVFSPHSTCQRKFAFTLAEVFSPHSTCQRKFAFTLAEVLIVIGVIGIVAAMVMPTVINETKDKEYAAARKKALATIGEAVRIITVQGDVRYAENAKDFVEGYLKKQIQMIKTCDNSNLRDCGIETGQNKIISLAETKITMPTKIGDLATGMSSGSVTDSASTSYGFIMSNGYAVNLFYNPSCLSDNKDANHWGQDRVCVNAVYDMNGLAMPNEVGKDIGFVSIIYPDIKVQAVAPDVHKQNAASANFDNASMSCQNQDKNYSLPNRDELLSMYYNGTLLGITSGYCWSASEATPELGWTQNFGNGYRYRYAKSNTNNVRCVRR